MDRQAICQNLVEPQVRVVLLWGISATPQTSPRDLDLHLVGSTARPTLTGGTAAGRGAPSDRFHIGYANGTSQMSYNETTGAYLGYPGDSAGTKSTASWVLDDTSYGGPEAMNIFRYGGGQYAKGIYSYSVYKYASSATANSGWGTQTISMYVWDSQGLVTKVSFPSNLSSVTGYWKALKINISGNSRAKRTIVEGGGFFSGDYTTKSSMDW